MASLLSPPAVPGGESGTRPRPRTLSPDRDPGKAKDSRVVPGQSRKAGDREGEVEPARPSREKDRQATPQDRDGKSVIRKESQEAPGGTKARPRREPSQPANPPESEDASRRVLKRILGEEGRQAGEPRSAGRSRDEKAGPAKDQATRQEIRSSQPRSSQPQANTPTRRSQPPRKEAPPPPKKEEKKKDKP